MILHPAKAKGPLLATRRKHQIRPLHFNLSLKDSLIKQVNEQRHLGVIIDDEFGLDHKLLEHVKQHLKKKKRLFFLSQLKNLLDSPKRKFFYHAHISPHQPIGSTVWDGCSDRLFNKHNSLHRRDGKFMISGSSLRTDTKLRCLGLLPLKEKRMFNKTALAFKAYKTLAPPYLKELLTCSTSRATC